MYAKPTTLEEAFTMVQKKPLESKVNASSNPFDRFVLALAKVVDHEQKHYVPKTIESVAEDLADQIITEQEVQEYPPIYIEEAMTKLTNALQRARVEALYQIKQQEAELQEEVVVEDEEEIVESKGSLVEPNSLDEVLIRLVESLGKNKEQTEEQNEELEASTETSEEDSTTETVKNPYVDELARGAKNEPALPQGSIDKSELKKMIAEQIGSEIESLKRLMFASEMFGGGGGGGTNAVQYAAGGTMNGDLNVNGTILSAGLTLNEVIQKSIFTTIAGISSQFGTSLPDPAVFTDETY